MTKNDILNFIVDNAEFKKAVQRICPQRDLVNDVYNDLLLKVYNIPENKLIDLYNRKALLFYFIRIIQYEKLWLNYQSIGLDKDIEQIEEEQETFKASDIAIYEIEKSTFEDKTDKYLTLVTKEYLKAGSLRKLSEKTGIPYRSLGLAVNQFRDRIVLKEKQYQIYMAKNVLNDLNDETKKKLYLASLKAGKSPEKIISDYINDLDRKLQNDTSKAKSK
jgi:hypothetical protein